MAERDDWEQVWDERVAALERLLGPQEGGNHSPVPFQLGGDADVLVFPHHLDGFVYVTADLTGPEGDSYGDYELAIVQRKDDAWGPNAISRLAPYTQEAVIASGEGMDIRSATPEGSAIQAFVFDTYGRFEAFGRTLELRLCVGITHEELELKLRDGAEALLSRLKAAGVYPYTDLARRSTVAHR